LIPAVMARGLPERVPAWGREGGREEERGEIGQGTGLRKGGREGGREGVEERTWCIGPAGATIDMIPLRPP